MKSCLIISQVVDSNDYTTSATLEQYDGVALMQFLSFCSEQEEGYLQDTLRIP